MSSLMYWKYTNSLHNLLISWPLSKGNHHRVYTYLCSSEMVWSEGKIYNIEWSMYDTLQSTLYSVEDNVMTHHFSTVGYAVLKWIWINVNVYEIQKCDVDLEQALPSSEKPPWIWDAATRVGTWDGGAKLLPKCHNIWSYNTIIYFYSILG